MFIYKILCTRILFSTLSAPIILSLNPSLPLCTVRRKISYKALLGMDIEYINTKTPGLPEVFGVCILLIKKRLKTQANSKTTHWRGKTTGSFCHTGGGINSI